VSQSPPQPGLAWTLAADIRTLSRKLSTSLREHGGRSDFKPSQIAVLLRLENEGPATVSSLARAQAMRPQTMSAIVVPLQEAGLVGAAPDPTDGRQTLLSLTPHCVKWFKEARDKKQDWLSNTIAQKLSASEQKDLQAALQLLTRLLEE